MARFPADRLDPACYPTSVEIPVLYGDLDPNRHVNNVSMGRFFEHSRVMATGPVLEERFFFLVARVSIDYLAEAHFGSPLTVSTRFARLGTSSMTIEQVATQKGSPVSLCEAVLVHVVDGRPAPFPVAARERLLAAVAPASPAQAGRS